MPFASNATSRTVLDDRRSTTRRLPVGVERRRQRVTSCRPIATVAAIGASWPRCDRLGDDCQPDDRPPVCVHLGEGLAFARVRVTSSPRVHRLERLGVAQIHLVQRIDVRAVRLLRGGERVFLGREERAPARRRLGLGLAPRRHAEHDREREGHGGDAGYHPTTVSAIGSARSDLSTRALHGPRVESVPTSERAVILTA